MDTTGPRGGSGRPGTWGCIPAAGRPLVAGRAQYLERVAASLLDVSRLQAGALPVFPRSAVLGEIIVSSLGELGPLARAIGIEVPCHPPEVMADPALTERIIVNLANNALRYTPARSPLRLTARALGDRVELRC